jgi:hypothetical protein
VAAWRAFGAVPTALTLTFLCLSFFGDWLHCGSICGGLDRASRAPPRSPRLRRPAAPLSRRGTVFRPVPRRVKWAQARLGRGPSPRWRPVLRGVRSFRAVGRAHPLTDQRSSCSTSCPRSGCMGIVVNSVTGPDPRVHLRALELDGGRGGVRLERRSRKLVGRVLPLLRRLSPGSPSLILRARPIKSATFAVPSSSAPLSLTGYYYSFRPSYASCRGGPGSQVSVLEMASGRHHGVHVCLRADVDRILLSSGPRSGWGSSCSSGWPSSIRLGLRGRATCQRSQI